MEGRAKALGCSVEQCLCCAIPDSHSLKISFYSQDALLKYHSLEAIWDSVFSDKW